MAQLSDTAGETIVVTGATTDALANSTYVWSSTGVYTEAANSYTLTDSGTAWEIETAVPAVIYTAQNYSLPLGSYTPDELTLKRYPAAPTLLDPPDHN